MSDFSFKDYFEKVKEMLEDVEKTQEEDIHRAAELVSDAVEKDGLIHTFGTGHSHMIAEEPFFRAGTLAPVNLVYDPSLAGTQQTVKSAYVERLEGYGEILLDYVKPDPQDVFIIISNSGRNAAPVEFAMELQERENPTIAITSLTYSKHLSSRHSSGNKLFELADVVLDNQGEIGDVALRVPEMEQGFGPTSTITGTYILNAILVQAVLNLIDKSVEPPVFWSGNLDQGMEKNQEMVDEFWGRIRGW
ncbi:MAG: sugar isomerase domain-containing protein [Candidatus Bipolaricaulota bacterium]